MTRTSAAPQMSEKATRVLLIEGDTFTGSLVKLYASYLGASGRFEMNGLGWRVPDALPNEISRDVFQTYSFFPDPVVAPAGAIDLLKLGAEYLGSPKPPEPLSGEPRGFKSAIYRTLLWNRFRKHLRPRLAGFDIYHWHCFLPEYLPVLDYVPLSAPVLISLWGSDLYRTAGVEELKRQLAVCRRPCRFTVGSIEMRETFLAKFGRQFADKVRIVTYGTTISRFDEARGERNSFLQSVGIPSERIAITVGNSGSVGNQHVRVLGEILRLSPELRSRIALLIPMTYAALPGHVETVRQSALAVGVPFHIFESRMTDHEVIRLRAATDVFVHVPISDQFSSAMCESLSAGSVLVTGAWLPYSRLRLSGIPYHEIGDMADLSGALQFVLSHLDEEKAKTLGSDATLRAMVSWEAVQPQWEALYRELLAAGSVIPSTTSS